MAAGPHGLKGSLTESRRVARPFGKPPVRGSCDRPPRAATGRLTAERRQIFRRERQFEPVSEAGLLWAVWSDVDWLDAVWS